MTENVIEMSRGPLRITERLIEIGSEADAYIVRRTVCEGTDRGFITVRDADGRTLFGSRDVPEESIAPMIIAYRCGVCAGRAQMTESLS
ncbi:hypothetical protein BF49_5613 [Bradyrhizobium sp.]|uniref:hypothetical protein n=1 Tax=Bradyrhizobium sp. TaxID=376 RepID=UPI0007C1E69F|nr:hypothetical protein [Bradyrhizobium sp.]CUT14533.1 hypothetical protein BF49_5613 [Bradyrhizobium sp.]